MSLGFQISGQTVETRDKGFLMTMKESVLETITAGRYWHFKCLIIILLAVLIFTCTPSLLQKENYPLPPAYALKAEKPFADTTHLTIPEHSGERSHGAKLTSRLFGSVLLWITTKLSWHPYLFATIFGFLFLLSGIVVSYYISKDRIVGFFTGILFSGLYASSACFSVNWTPKPFDGVAIGLLGAALIAVPKPWLFSILAFLSCWTDERAILGILNIGVVILLWPSMSKQAKRLRCALLVGAIVAYLFSRMIIASALGWASPDLGFVGENTVYAFSFLQLGVWSVFEGGWIIVVYSLWLLMQKPNHFRFSIFLISICISIFSSLLVLDVSRSLAFSFPLIFGSIAILQGSGLGIHEMRYFTGVSAGISVLAPNFEIIVGIAVKWLPPYFVYLLLK